MRTFGLVWILGVTACAPANDDVDGSQRQSLIDTNAEWTRYGLDAGDAVRARKGPFTDLDGDGLPELIVNSPDRDGVEAGAGACSVFAGQSGGPSPLAVWSIEGGVEDASLRCWPAGDVDGDGYGDILAAEPYWGGANPESGRATLYCGGPAYPSTTPCWSWEPDQVDAHLWWATSVGDINGDGFMDVAALAAGWDDVLIDEDAVWVFLGTGSGLPSVPDWEWTCGQAGCLISGVWGAGDVNGDGYAELLVGASGYSGAFNSEGRLELFAGSSSGPAPTSSLTRLGGANNYRLGSDGGGVGDVNGDGFADFAVGAYGGGPGGRGRVDVYAGGDLTVLGSILWSTVGGPLESHRHIVGPPIDLNRDGYGDVLIGEPGRDTGLNGIAAVFLGGPTSPTGSDVEVVGGSGDELLGLGAQLHVLGDPEGLRATAVISESTNDQAGANAGAVFGHRASAAMPEVVLPILQYDSSFARIGRSEGVDSPADFNGDGFDDVVVASRHWPSFPTDAGRVEVLMGSVGGPLPAVWTVESTQDGAEYGRDTATGDVNGDGYDELIITAPYWDNGPTAGPGRLEAYLGGAGGLSTSVWWSYEAALDATAAAKAVELADLNCDGYADLATSNKVSGEIVVHLFLADSGGLPSSPSLLLPMPDAVATPIGLASGDFDGDGCDDLAVGDHLYVVSPVAEGRIQVYLGAAGGPSVSADWTLNGDLEAARYGWHLHAGDLNGDGFSDIVSSSWFPSSNPGQVWVDYGGPGGPTGQTRLDLAELFVRAGAVADVQGDGIPDLRTSSQGASRLYFGATVGVATSSSASVLTSLSVSVGTTMGTSGDFDGDGFGDGIVQSEYTVSLQSGATASGHAPITTRPRIRDLDGSPLAHGNRTDAVAFELYWPDVLLPQGPARAKIQVEAKPGGTVFDGGDLVESVDWIHVAGPMDISLLVDELDSDTAYHWRARLRFDPAQGPAEPVGRWYYGDPLHPQGPHVRTASDLDGDGYIADDCDDTDPDINPGAAEICDGLDQDCDGQLDEDFDTDGDGALADTPDCVALVGASAIDCDDADPAAFPGATEVCDGDTEACGSPSDFGFDQDGDGAFDGSDGGCALAYGGDADCDDANSLIHPGASEGCDGIDTDCDASLGPDELDDDFDGETECDGDCDDAVATTNLAAPELCNAVDDDCDSLVDAADPDTDADGDGYSACGDDCDDSNPAAWPGAAEVCADGLDTDCDGDVVDEFVDTDADGTPDCLDPDADGDGFASIPAGGADCDDVRLTVYPGAPEVCDGLDGDCDGVVPADEVDADGDGYVACVGWTGSAALAEGDCDSGDSDVHPSAPEGCDGLDTDCDGAPTAEEIDDDGDGVAECEGDCDDTDPAVFPSATEACTGVDEDCDGLIDDDDPDTDADLDGFGLCDDPADCDDGNPDAWPGATETCDDGVDTDCDGSLVDEFLDNDGDGTPDCIDPDADGDGHAALDEGGGDCDDAAATVHPGADELCDGLDNDCTAGVPGDEVDGDGDGAAPCAPWVGDGSLIGGDCNDVDGAVHPAAFELCDGRDQNCDGAIDEGLPSADWYRDDDRDGFGDPESPHESNPGCDPGEGWTDDNTDCDDGDAESFPGATEVEGNRVDEDCDGTAQGAPADGAEEPILAPGISCSAAGGGGPVGLLLLALVRRRIRRAP